MPVDIDVDDQSIPGSRQPTWPHWPALPPSPPGALAYIGDKCDRNSHCGTRKPNNAWGKSQRACLEESPCCPALPTQARQQQDTLHILGHGQPPSTLRQACCSPSLDDHQAPLCLCDASSLIWLPELCSLRSYLVLDGNHVDHNCCFYSTPWIHWPPSKPNLGPSFLNIWPMFKASQPAWLGSQVSLPTWYTALLLKPASPPLTTQESNSLAQFCCIFSTICLKEEKRLLCDSNHLSLLEPEWSGQSFSRLQQLVILGWAVYSDTWRILTEIFPQSFF